MCTATIRYVAAHCGFGGFVPPRKSHLTLRWPFLVCNRLSKSTATRPTNAPVKSARKPIWLLPASALHRRMLPAWRASGGVTGPSRTGSTTKEIPSWVRMPVAPAKLPSPSPLCATFCWVSYTSSPPLCFAVFVASPPIPCPSIAGLVGVYDKSLVQGPEPGQLKVRLG